MKKTAKTICTCSRCNKPFSYSAMQVEAGIIDPEKPLCKECRDRIVAEEEKAARRAAREEQERRNAVAEERTCKDCLRVFPITVGETEWFGEKGFALPVRCPMCRARRRAQRKGDSQPAASVA